MLEEALCSGMVNKEDRLVSIQHTNKGTVRVFFDNDKGRKYYTYYTGVCVVKSYFDNDDFWFTELDTRFGILDEDDNWFNVDYDNKGDL